MSNNLRKLIKLRPRQSLVYVTGDSIYAYIHSVNIDVDSKELSIKIHPVNKNCRQHLVTGKFEGGYDLVNVEYQLRRTLASLRNTTDPLVGEIVCLNGPEAAALEGTARPLMDIDCSSRLLGYRSVWPKAVPHKFIHEKYPRKWFQPPLEVTFLDHQDVEVVGVAKEYSISAIVGMCEGGEKYERAKYFINRLKDEETEVQMFQRLYDLIKVETFDTSNSDIDLPEGLKSNKEYAIEYIEQMYSRFINEILEVILERSKWQNYKSYLTECNLN